MPCLSAQEAPLRRSFTQPAAEMHQSQHAITANLIFVQFAGCCVVWVYTQMLRGRLEGIQEEEQGVQLHILRKFSTSRGAFVILCLKSQLL